MAIPTSDAVNTIFSIGVERKYGKDAKWNIERTKEKDTNGNTVYVFGVQNEGVLVYQTKIYGVYRKDQIEMSKCLHIMIDMIES